MKAELIFLPVVAHMWMVFALYIKLKSAKSKALLTGQVDRVKASLDGQEWTDDVIQISNNIANQFQSPVIFYVLTVIFYSTGNASYGLLLLSSIYVLSRFAHAYVHITTNDIPQRVKSFALGILVLLVQSIYLVYVIV